ncbi:DUF2628 domain-containing protein [Chelatococcus reniformis]|uniref:DUF2628 domain-containing protein n=1 Tax=Chelatococcus reniformis TaxID=1494448 RepID=A0A916X8F4_9HYPH|nr:DUF2628 domain-containing protein [Chelatococcus reniformis]GGC51811.1 hypothetical protein GCM10010994_08660 [Chelatococcus reniformis]
MTPYVLYVPEDAQPGNAAALKRAEVVKDGIAWWAVLFPLLWFIWHRLWLGTLAVLAAGAALSLACYLLDVDRSAASLAHLALVVFFALEANQIRGWTLQRRGFAAVDAVLDRSRAGAETKLFARWLAGEAQAVAAPRSASPTPRVSAPGPVVGLFPEPGGGR